MFTSCPQYSSTILNFISFYRESLCNSLPVREKGCFDTSMGDYLCCAIVPIICSPSVQILTCIAKVIHPVFYRLGDSYTQCAVLPHLDTRIIIYTCRRRMYLHGPASVSVQFASIYLISDSCAQIYRYSLMQLEIQTASCFLWTQVCSGSRTYQTATSSPAILRQIRSTLPYPGPSSWLHNTL